MKHNIYLLLIFVIFYIYIVFYLYVISFVKFFFSFLFSKVKIKEPLLKNNGGTIIEKLNVIHQKLAERLCLFNKKGILLYNNARPHIASMTIYYIAAMKIINIRNSNLFIVFIYQILYLLTNIYLNISIRS